MWNMLNPYFATTAAKNNSFEVFQPYLIILGVAFAMAVGSVLIWKFTFDFNDERQVKDAKLWGIVLTFVGALLLLGGFFYYQIIEQLSTRVAIIEGVGIGLMLGMFAVGTFSYDRASSAQSAIFSGFSLFTVLAALVALGAINYFANERAKKFDFNENQLESLSDQTTKVLKNLKEKVTVVGFFYKREKRFEDTARVFFAKYREVNRDKFEYRFYNPLEHPDLVACYGLSDSGGGAGREQLSKRLLLVKGACEESKAPKSASIGGGSLVFKGKKIVLEKMPPTEQEVTNKLIQITRDSKKICFATGRAQPSIKDEGQFGYSSLNGILKDKGFETMEIDIFSRDEVPKDCDLLIQAAPEFNVVRAQGGAPAKLSEKEIRAVERYLQQGGQMLVLQEPMVTTGIEDILASYGVKSGKGIVIDFYFNVGSQAGGPLAPVSGSYPEPHPIVEGFRGASRTVFRIATLVEPATPAPKDTKVLKLIETQKAQFRALSDKTCCSYYFDNPNDPKFFQLLNASRRWKTEEMLRQVAMGIVEKNFPGTRNGPFSLAVAVERKVKGSKKDTRLVVFGDATLASNALLAYNEALLINSIAWLAQESDLVHIPAKQRKPTSIQLSSIQRNFLRYTNRYGMPALFLFLILFVSAIRRLQ